MIKQIYKIPKGWKAKDLESICDLQAGKFISASKILKYKTKNLYPCFGGNGIRGYVDNFSHNGIFPLIGRQGALCGNINKATGKFYATEHAVIVTPDLEIEVNWLFYHLIFADLNKYATGVAQPGLSVKNIKKVKFVVPPFYEQKAIADLLTTWDDAIEKTEKLIHAKEKRFKWLLRKLISKQSTKNVDWKKIKLGEVCNITKGKQLNVAHMKENGVYYALNGGIKPK